MSDDEFVSKHARLFDSKLGHLEQYTARFEVDSTAEPKFYKARPFPRNVIQLKSFLGMLNYYNTFFPSHSHNLAPLHKLLQKNTPWIWGPEHQDAFKTAKVALTSDKTLAHFDPEKKLILACDASPYGLGVVLSHKFEDGVQYLVGRHFFIQSDHKPLEHLFKEMKGLPTLASARLQRWALTLGAYDYTITYKPGPQHCNADVLNRLPLPNSPENVLVPQETVMAMEMLCVSIPVQPKQLKQWTDKDPFMSKVRHKVQTGWEDTQDPAWKPYQQYNLELRRLLLELQALLG